MGSEPNEENKAEISDVWSRYTSAVATEDKPIDVYRAERDAYVRQINTSSAVVKSVESLDVPGPAGPIPIRIYHPVTHNESPLPVLLYLHGGGWTVGGGDALDGTYRTYCAATECLLVTPDYRLAPEWKFPAAVEDCWATAEWLAKHAGQVGGDSKRVCVAGESSGGNLAAVLAHKSRHNSVVKFLTQVLVYPALDLRATTASYVNAKDTFTRDKLDWYIRSYIRDNNDRTDPIGSPVLAAAFDGLPDTVLVTGGDDPLLDEAEDYATKLRNAGVKVSYLRLDGWPHGFAFWPDTEAYQKSLDFTVTAIRRAAGMI